LMSMFFLWWLFFFLGLWCQNVLADKLFSFVTCAGR
jgi:hypothetical protein